VRRALKVVVWLGVFAACAGAGALVASRTDPFPPGVEDPGAASTVSPAARSPEPEPANWSVEMTSRTRHEFHVGGACRTNWLIAGPILVSSGGTAGGHVVARLQGDADCDFPVAQVQTQSIRLRVEGSIVGDRFRMSFHEGGRDPVGSKDLGGLTNTLSAITPRGAAGRTVKLTVTRPDGDLGRYVSETKVRLTCSGGGC
jgi:hypothetical protein